MIEKISAVIIPDVKHRYHVLPILLSGILISFSGFAQKKSENPRRTDPYQLMSKYYEDDFNPFAKGNWYVGFAFSLQDQRLQNQSRLFDKVLDGQDLNYDLTFRGGYFLNNFLMAGANFIYSRDKFTGTVVQESDTIIRQNITGIGTIVPSLKTYFPLTKNNRLSFFNELGLGVGFGKTVTRDTRNKDEINKSHTDEFAFTAGISPGITFFAIENFAFEIQLNNLIGYKLQVSNKTTNETEESKITTHNVNFNIDLLSLNLGLAYYFGTKKRRK
ncbi:MAG: hypothetical protein MI975_07670 [Cytophagales bacterium]|nr:hypothetical protein [Cytophagales bacterium]